MEYVDPTDEIIDQIMTIQKEHYAQLLREGYIPGMEDPELLLLLDNTMRMWKLPSIDEMRTPIGLQYCKTRRDALYAIRGDYWDLCVSRFQERLQEVRACFFPRYLISIEVEELLADRITNILFEEDIGRIHNEATKYLRARTEELIELAVTWALEKDKKEEFHNDSPSQLS
jgi:hypothetical protein